MTVMVILTYAAVRPHRSGQIISVEGTPHPSAKESNLKNIQGKYSQ